MMTCAPYFHWATVSRTATVPILLRVSGLIKEKYDDDEALEKIVLAEKVVRRHLMTAFQPWVHWGWVGQHGGVPTMQPVRPTPTLLQHCQGEAGAREAAAGVGRREWRQV